MRPMPTWAASSSLRKVEGRPGGAVACARLGSRTGGKRGFTIVQMATAAPTTVAEQSAPAMIWPTTTQRWQRSGTGRPMGKAHQTLWQQTAISMQPGGVASVGTDGAPLWLREHSQGLGAPGVLVRPAASRHRSPASAVEPHTCWLSGTGKPMGHMAGTQTGSLWAQPKRCTGSCRTSASWAWCTGGRHHHIVALD